MQPRRRKASPIDPNDRPARWQFAQRFNDEILNRAPSFARACSIRGAVVESMKKHPEVTADQGFAEASRLVGPLPGDQTRFEEPRWDQQADA